MTILREHAAIFIHRDSAYAILLVALLLAVGFLYGINFPGFAGAGAQ